MNYYTMDSDVPRKQNVIVDKSYALAIEIVRVYMELKSQKEYDLARQLLRSGTSIGANIQESQSAQSTKDFIHKLSIAQKETKETLYWINLLKDSTILKEETANKLLGMTREVDKILSSIIITTKKKNN